MSDVFFADLKTTHEMNLFKKLERLLYKIDLISIIEKDDLVAIKLHFGERGNTSYVQPIYLRKIVDRIKEFGGKPFLTDTNTLYVGSRGDAVSHLKTAIENGFAYSVVNAPLIIADGLRGRSFKMVRIDKKWYKEVDIAEEIYNADALIAVTHFKCHELSGIGGTIKNLGMGCASIQGKLNQHSTVSPYVDQERCTGCGRGQKWCGYKAIVIEDKKERIIPDICVGCGECIHICPTGAIRIRWDASTMSVQEKMAEHTIGALQNKGGKYAFITFITQISPACDCYPSNDIPIVRDVGILASRDPIAIDQASADLVNNQIGNRDSNLTCNYESGEDKFRGVYPHIDWTIQLSYGESLGLGSRGYKLIKI
ncbi:MAG: DUF362 domain-containing protein [Nitrospinae bacterium]|nr:DUF362 domain-containing protein [Nitrospinota bacterium]